MAYCNAVLSKYPPRCSVFAPGLDQYSDGFFVIHFGGAQERSLLKPVKRVHRGSVIEQHLDDATLSGLRRYMEGIIYLVAGNTVNVCVMINQ